MALRSVRSPRKRLLVHLSQSVETLALRRVPITHVEPLKGSLNGKVQVQFLQVTGPEFSHFEKISEALDRLDQGTYGQCNCCRKRIESHVLNEKPWATLCLECLCRDSQA